MRSRPESRRRVWVDLANSPHIAFFAPLVTFLESKGWDVVLTARDHAQTVPLARQLWPDIPVVGGSSPPSVAAKGAAILRRAAGLSRFVRSTRPDVALSHASYAQALVASAHRVPIITLMDYEYQPANHISFRLASKVVVPDAFPSDALRRFGVAASKLVRYSGYKEELYLSDFVPQPSVLKDLGVRSDAIVAVMRPPPDGALYHRNHNSRFDRLLELARQAHGVQTILLPRSEEQRRRYPADEGLIVPTHAVDGRSLLALADVVIGAGGTMSREAALLGTPTYTVFQGPLAAVDRELMRAGLLHDIREGGVPLFTKKRNDVRMVGKERALHIMETVAGTLTEVHDR